MLLELYLCSSLSIFAAFWIPRSWVVTAWEVCPHGCFSHFDVPVHTLGLLSECLFLFQQSGRGLRLGPGLGWNKKVRIFQVHLKCILLIMDFFALILIFKNIALKCCLSWLLSFFASLLILGPMQVLICLTLVVALLFPHSRRENISLPSNTGVQMQLHCLWRGP